MVCIRLKTINIVKEKGLVFKWHFEEDPMDEK